MHSHADAQKSSGPFFGVFPGERYRKQAGGRRNALRASEAVHARDVMFNPGGRQIRTDFDVFYVAERFSCRSRPKSGTRQMKKILLILLMVTSFSSVSKEMSKDGLDESKMSDPDRLLLYRDWMTVAENTPDRQKPVPTVNVNEWNAFCSKLIRYSSKASSTCRMQQFNIGIEKKNFCRSYILQSHDW